MRAEALTAWKKGEDSIEADAGALVIADFMDVAFLWRASVTKRRRR